MSSAHVYATNGFSEHEAQDNFARQFDLANPEAARSSYQRVMHQHTKQQFELATASDRRRSSNSSGPVASLATETSNSSTGAMSSTAS